MSADAAPEPLPTRLRRLRDERGLSRSQLSRSTVAYDNKGLAEATVKALEEGRNQAGPRTIEALAHALDVPADEFPEYRLALARNQLDEREVGLAQALAKLAEAPALESAKPTVTERARRAAQRLDGTPRASRGTRRAAGGEDADQ